MEIQSDIVRDILLGMRYTIRYLQRDSLKNQLFNNKVTPDDIKSGRINPYRAAFRYDAIYIRSNGFDKLILSIDNVPKKYNELINSLNVQYKTRGVYFENLSNRFIEDCFKNQTIRNHLDWYPQDEFSGIISDQQIDYYLNDPEFKELAIGMSYDATSLFGAITSYWGMALNSYFIIEDLLGNEALETPGIIMRTTLTDADQAKRLSGRYRLVTGPPNTEYGKEFEMTSEGKQLYIKRNNEDAQLLYPWAPKKMEFFVSGGRSLIMFSSESSDKITIVHGTSDNTIWEKY